MKRLLCFIGLHDWKTTESTGLIGMSVELLQQCDRCRRKRAMRVLATEKRSINVEWLEAYIIQFKEKIEGRK